MSESNSKAELATFGAGCFWGVEAAFARLAGVLETAAGYLGGTTVNPSYRDVCSGKTGHAEVVQVKFDPMIVSYEQLLELFWTSHDPTTLNRQGPDVGSQYRSTIFYHSEAQKSAAERSKAEQGASGRFAKPLVTEITPATQFYRAEDYHQGYLAKQGLSSCRI